MIADTNPFQRVTLPDGRLSLDFHAHPGQAAALDCTARFLLVLAGTQSGKSVTIAPWLHQEIRRYPECDTEGEADYLVASANYDLLSLKVMPATIRYFTALTGWGSWEASKRLIRSRRDQSRIIFRSAEAPGSLESATGRAAALDEFGLPSVPLMAWEAVQRRVSIHQGRVSFWTTPYTLNWLYQQVYMRAKGGDTDYAVVNFRSIDNPHFSPIEWERAKRTLPDWKFRMMYCGEFTRPAGLIYGDYIDAYAPQTGGQEKWGPVDLSRWENGVHGHLVRPFTIPDTWLRYVGIDFGGTEHTALTWWAQEPGTGRYYGYREALGGGLSGAEHARRALEYGEPVAQWVGGAKSEKESRLSWEMAGVSVEEPWIHDVETGIDRVVSLLRQNRLFVFETLTGLRSELGTYSRELDAAGEPLLRIEDKERFHRTDTLRYFSSLVDMDVPELPEAERDLSPDEERGAIMDAIQDAEDGVGRDDEPDPEWIMPWRV